MFLLLVFLQWVNFLNFFLRPKFFGDLFFVAGVAPLPFGACRIRRARSFLGFSEGVWCHFLLCFHEVLWPNCQILIFQLFPTCYFVKFFCSRPQHWTCYSNRHQSSSHLSSHFGSMLEKLCSSLLTSHARIILIAFMPKATLKAMLKAMPKGDA